MGKYLKEEPKNKKAHKLRFFPFMVVYSLILVLILSAGIAALWKFVDAYEKSLPSGAIEEYKLFSMEDDYREALRVYADSLQTPFQSGEEILAMLVKENAELNLKKEQTLGEKLPFYQIRLGKKQVGTLLLRQEPLPFPSFGFMACKVDHAEWDVAEDLGIVYEVSAHQDAAIYVNGIMLNEENSEVSTQEIPIPLISQGLEAVNEEQYTFLYYGVPEMTVKDSDDLIFTLSETDAQRYKVDAEIRSETCVELGKLAESFVRDYIAYTSNAGAAYTVQQYLISGTSMYSRISGSLDGMSWVLGVTAQISDLHVDHFVPYGEGVLCEAHYKLTDLDNNTVPADMRILLVQNEGAWKVYNIEMI